MGEASADAPLGGLTEADRSRILKELSGLRPEIRGQNVERLVELLSRAVAIEAKRAASPLEVELRQQLQDLATVALRISNALPIPQLGWLSAPQPTYEWPEEYSSIHNTIKSSIYSYMDQDSGVKRLCAAIDEIVKLAKPRKDGRPAIIRDDRSIIIAVCVYQFEQGILPEYDWTIHEDARQSARNGEKGKRGGNQPRIHRDDFKPNTATSKLLVACYKSLGREFEPQDLSRELKNYGNNLDAHDPHPDDIEEY